MSYRDLNPSLARLLRAMQGDIESLKSGDHLDGPVTLTLPLRLAAPDAGVTVLIDLATGTDGSYHLTAVIEESNDHPSDVWANG